MAVKQLGDGPGGPDHRQNQVPTSTTGLRLNRMLCNRVGLGLAGAETRQSNIGRGGLGETNRDACIQQFRHAAIPLINPHARLRGAISALTAGLRICLTVSDRRRVGTLGL